MTGNTLDGNNDLQAGGLLLHSFIIDVAQTNATLTVNSTNDANDGTCGQWHCLLREAINRANAEVGSNIIAFNLSGAAPHVISPLSPLNDGSLSNLQPQFLWSSVSSAVSYEIEILAATESSASTIAVPTNSYMPPSSLLTTT
jgi:CSLREA domain-containing protein